MALFSMVEVQNEGNPLGKLKISCLIEQGGSQRGGREGGRAKQGEFPNGRRRRPKKMIKRFIDCLS